MLTNIQQARECTLGEVEPEPDIPGEYVPMLVVPAEYW